jgi:CHAD domain-containing protein
MERLTAFEDAAREVIAERTAALFKRDSRDVLDLGDIENVHKMRVATRRLRAALEVFAPALDRRRGKRALHAVKILAEALGERRDRDVQLEALEELKAAAAGAERRAVEILIAELRDEQQHANVELAKALGRVRGERLQQRLEKLAQ